MAASSPYYPARPLRAEELRERLAAPLLREVESSTGIPSLAQTLTRLHHLQQRLFRAEDWEELEWLVGEGTHWERRREGKHPLFKIGPRRRLQERVQHFHGRAAVKTVALLQAMAPPYRRLLARQRPEICPLPSMPLLPWRVLQLGSPERFGAPTVRQSGALLEAAIPLAEQLVELAMHLGLPTAKATEACEHFAWHAREIRTATIPGRPWNPFRPRAARTNRLLRVALEQGRDLLGELRRGFLTVSSQPAAGDLDSLFPSKS